MNLKNYLAEPHILRISKIIHIPVQTIRIFNIDLSFIIELKNLLKIYVTLGSSRSSLLACSLLNTEYM